MPKPAVSFNTGEVVVSAIKKLMKNTGWSARTIIKFIKMEYSICDPKISRKVSRALKRGVRLGLLQMERGRYRLNDMARLTRPVSAREIRLRPRYRPRERPLRIVCSRASSCASTRKYYYRN
ncbi:hypothetical protein O3G_MSEX005562 [Manduca sexta]|uniref:H15 domain-containing protein n=1 Tax=Manduca sexta TaxID=7130 RepID=A0A921Z098_MANSE|nr:hypothetical protein O3G_MSEX005562 [Manduca sexta]